MVGAEVTRTQTGEWGFGDKAYDSHMSILSHAAQSATPIDATHASWATLSQASAGIQARDKGGRRGR